MDTQQMSDVVAKEVQSNDAIANWLSNDPFSVASSSETVSSYLEDSAVISRTVSSTSFSDGSASLDEADTKLQAVLATEGLDKNEEPSIQPRADPYAHFQCEFGWTGTLDTPEAVPKTQGVFLEAIKDELNAVAFVKHGLNSYIEAINSGEHHVFADDFLEHQNKAYTGSMNQLNTIAEHLKYVADEVEGYHDNDAEIKQELQDAFSHARPWITRIRKILLEAHVFYKVNYVLASSKKIFKHARHI